MSPSPSRTGTAGSTPYGRPTRDAERLAGQVQVLQGEVVKLQEQGEENQRLKSLLDFQDKGTFPAGTDFLVARVIGKSPTRWQAWIQIDKGSADGLRAGPARGRRHPAGRTRPLAGKGLVGKMIEVTAARGEGSS